METTVVAVSFISISKHVITSEMSEQIFHVTHDKARLHPRVPFQILDN